MENKFRVACFQTCSSDDPQENFKMLDQIFNRIKNKSFDLICLPECVSIFTDSKKIINNYIENFHDHFINLMKEKAKFFGANILIGSHPFKKKNEKFSNRSLLIDSSGNVICYYDKINLFDVDLGKNESYLESKNFDAGKFIKIANLPFGKLGMSICYDLRFPNLFKKLAKKGADFFSIPAAFTYTTGKSHWHTLIRARAIENGCYVFAPAQCGTHKNGRKTFGHSLIVDPWGKILSEAKDDICFIDAVIDKNLILNSRKRIPSMSSY